MQHVFSKSLFGHLLWVAAALGVLAMLLTHPAHAGRDDVAVVIGNRDYGPETPAVKYAVNDARAMKSFLVERLGYREENIIYHENATLGQMLGIFGDARSGKGQLLDWVRAGRSNVFVYYSGHGAPGIADKRAYLIPSDINPQTAERGYPLDQLQQNLEAVKQAIGPDRSLVLMLDACFSGQTVGDTLLDLSAGIVPRVARPTPGIVRISAGRSDQVANWDRRNRHSLLTSKFLEGLRGPADAEPFGDGDGQVIWPELASYVADEVRYWSRREYRRDQDVEFPAEAGLQWRFDAEETEAEKLRRHCREEPARWQSLESGRDLEAMEQALATFQCPEVRSKAESRIASLRDEQRRLEREREAERRRIEEEEREKKRLLEKQLEALREERRKLQEQRKKTLARRSEPDTSANPARNLAQTVWHNGSRMQLRIRNGNVRITYTQPSRRMRRAVGLLGDLLFTGRLSGGHISGTAYTYSSKCRRKYAYTVSGSYSHGADRFELRGAAPRVRGCRHAGSRWNDNSYLVFTR